MNNNRIASASDGSGSLGTSKARSIFCFAISYGFEMKIASAPFSKFDDDVCPLAKYLPPFLVVFPCVQPLLVAAVAAHDHVPFALIALSPDQRAVTPHTLHLAAV